MELGLARSHPVGEAAALVREAATACERTPLWVRLPLERAVDLAEVAVEAGADALVVGAPPRGTVLVRDRAITGRLYGPFVLPLALRALQQVAARVDVGLVGCGGIYDAAGATAFLKVGAVAVQVDAVIWQDPAVPARIAREVASVG